MVQFDCIEKPLSRAFYVYGRFIARHPIWFLVCPLLVTAALGSGFYNFHAEYDVEKLFTPEGARSKDERSTMQRLFHEFETSDNFSPTRMSTLGEYGRLIVTPKKTGRNVLTEDIFNEVEQLDKDIQNITVQNDGNTYNYSNLCAGSCEIATNILLLLHNMKVPLNKLSFPVHTVEPRHGANITFFLGSTIGGVSKTPGGDTKAEAWTLFYYLRSDENQTEQHNLTVRKWQTEFLTTLAKKSYKHITVTRFTAHSLEDELKRNADAVIPLSSILFTILTIFSIVLCMSADWVRSKPWLATVGVLSAGLALVSGFGLVLHAGIPFIDIVASSPFLILGKSSFLQMLQCISRKCSKTPDYC